MRKNLAVKLLHDTVKCLGVFWLLAILLIVIVVSSKIEANACSSINYPVFCREDSIKDHYQFKTVGQSINTGKPSKQLLNVSENQLFKTDIGCQKEKKYRHVLASFNSLDNTHALTTVFNPANKTKVSRDDIWNDVEVAAALKTCRKILLPLNADYKFINPIKHGPCGDPAPVKLIAFEGKYTVRFSAAAIVNCQMVLALDTWVRRGLQPLAQRYFGVPITSIMVMGSYSCRNRYNKKNARLSEHAKANALDVEGFYTLDGMRIDLLRHWGPTGRDITLKSAKFKSELSTKPLSYYQNFKSDVQILSMPIPELWSDIRQLHEQTKKEAVLPGSSKQRTELQDKLTYTSGLKNSFKRYSPTVDIKNSSHNALQKIPTNESRAAFLRGAHRAACKIFGTVLGPEANDAHRDHFHVDLAPRRYENYCR